MYYLKCEHCGHLNEFQSEFMVFCSACRKKLYNNYGAWKIRNTDKNLDDFKKLVCISGNDIQNIPVKKKSKRFNYLIGVLVGFVVVATGAIYGGNHILEYLQTGDTPAEILNMDWISETYGKYGLKVETPVKLTRGSLPVPDNVRNMIEDMDVYSYKSLKGFEIGINSVKYRPSVGEVNLQGAANGSINEMKMQEGVSDVVYDEEYTYKGDIPGFIQKGSYQFKGVNIEFQNAGFSKDFVFWQVFVAWHKDDKIGKMAAQKLMESIEISYPE